MAKAKRKPTPITTNGWKRLQALLGDKDQSSSPGVTLVLGAGIHRERAPTSTATSTAVNALGSWSGLLSHFATSQSLVFEPHGGNLALAWEGLAFKLGHHGPAWQREQSALGALQKLMAGFSETVPVLGKNASRLVTDPRFSNIINLNIDRFLIDELIKEEDRKVFGQRPLHKKCRKRGVDSDRLRAFSSVNRSRRIVWQPHGDVLLKRSLCLGSRAYLRSVMAFEKYRNKIWEVKRTSPAPKNRNATSYLSWADVMLHSHLVFVGCGLSFHDADIWFALNCRRRYWLQRPSAGPTTFIMRVDTKAYPIPREYGMVLSASNYADAWVLLGWALEGRAGGK